MIINTIIAGPTEDRQFSALYAKIMKGKQFSDATVLATCRPNVAQSVAGLSFDRIAEIIAFTPETVQELNMYKNFVLTTQIQ